MPVFNIQTITKAIGTLCILLFCSTSFAESVGCDDAFVQLNVNTLVIEIDPTGRDDTNNIQCALDAAISNGITTVELGPHTYSISSLLVEKFNGSFEGRTVASTTLVAIDQSMDCSAMESAGLTPSVIKFVNGEPRIRFMTIEAHKPCMGFTSRVQNILHFTGTPASNSDTCPNQVIFGAVDRVLLDGTDPADGPVVAVAANAESDLLPGCKQNLLGTFKLNRSTVMNVDTGAVTSMKSSAQVDINFNNFSQNRSDVIVPNANQSTTITGNKFVGVAGTAGDYAGIQVLTNDADAPDSNRVVVHKNTFTIDAQTNTMGAGIVFFQTEKVAKLSTIASENIFNLTGDSALGVFSGGVSGAVVNGNRFTGSAATGIFANTEGSRPSSDWTIMANVGFRNLSSTGPDIILGTDLSKSVVGPDQTPKVEDRGEENSVLPIETSQDVLDRLDNLETTVANGVVSTVTASSPLSSSGGTHPNISLSGTVPVSNGGTGRHSLDNNGVLFGNGTNAVGSTTGTTGQVLTGNSGSAPSWTGSPSLSGNLNVAGQVGIGTTTPSANLEVVSNSTAEILASAHGSIGLFIGQTANGSPGAESAVSKGMDLAWFAGRGHTGNGYSGSRGAMMVQASENWSDSANGAELAFGTTENGTSNRIERMRISHNGNVGIGTSTPDVNAQLEVQGRSTASIMVTSHNSLARIIGRTAGGSPEAQTASRAGDSLAWFSGQGHTGSGFSATRAVINMQASEDWTSSRNGTDIAFGTTLNGTSTRTERMRITNNGNVGIGTATPDTNAQLEIGGPSTTSLMVTAYDSLARIIGRTAGGSPSSKTATRSDDSLAFFSGQGFTGSDWTATRAAMNMVASENWTGSRNGTDISFQTTTNGTTSRSERMRITNAGNVGIGTTTPGAQLEVQGNSTTSMMVTAHNSDARFIGRTARGTPSSRSAITTGMSLAWFGGQGYTGSSFSFTRAVMDMVAAENWSSTRHGTNIRFGTTPIGSTSRREVMRIGHNGSVGIGTTTPGTKAKFEVNGFAGNNGVSTWGVYANTASGTFYSTSFFNTGGTSIHASARVLAGDLIIFSDERIKQIEGTSDAANDLATLMDIEVTDYQFIDTLARGTARHKKVIAQQVEEVYPQAVSQGIDVIPDIYSMASFEDGWVTLETDLKVGERVRLIAENSEGVHEVLEVMAGRFRTDFAAEGDTVFVYGREVDDFRMVDYEAIAMLNVSATQELYRLIEKQNARIAELAKDNQAQLALIDTLVDQNAEITILKKQMAALLAATPVAEKQLESNSLATTR